MYQDFSRSLYIYCFLSHTFPDEIYDEDDPLMMAARKIYSDCLSRGDEEEDEMYKALRTNITDLVRKWQSIELDFTSDIVSNAAAIL